MLKVYLGDSQAGGAILMTSHESEKKKLFTFANSSASLKDTRTTGAALPPNGASSVLQNASIQPSPYNITSVISRLSVCGRLITRCRYTQQLFDLMTRSHVL